MLGHVEQKGLNIVAFLMFSIGMACVIFAGLMFQKQPDVTTMRAFGLALTAFGVVLHAIGLFLLIKQGKTVSVIVVSIFFGFWSFAGFGLLLSDIISWGKPLMFIEPAIFFLVAGVLPWYYMNHKPLVPALVIIEVLLAHLWISKMWWPAIKHGCPYSFLFTAAAAFATGFYEFYKPLLRERREKKKEQKGKEVIQRKEVSQTA